MTPAMNMKDEVRQFARNPDDIEPLPEHDPRGPDSQEADE